MPTDAIQMVSVGRSKTYICNCLFKIHRTILTYLVPERQWCSVVALVMIFVEFSRPENGLGEQMYKYIVLILVKQVSKLVLLLILYEFQIRASSAPSLLVCAYLILDSMF